MTYLLATTFLYLFALIIFYYSVRGIKRSHKKQRVQTNSFDVASFKKVSLFVLLKKQRVKTNRFDVASFKKVSLFVLLVLTALYMMLIQSVFYGAILLFLFWNLRGAYIPNKYIIFLALILAVMFLISPQSRDVFKITIQNLLIIFLFARLIFFEK